MVNHFRDLGAHICFDHTNTNTTLAQRLHRATIWVRRLRCIPTTHQQKVHTIRTLILPAALYGSEVGHCPQAELKALQTAIVETIGPKSARRSMALVMELCSAGGDLDPQVCMLVRKVTLLLRILAKYPSTVIKARSLLCAYTTQHRRGTTAWLGLTGEDSHTHNFGPISHLLEALHQAGATISSDFVVQQAGETDLPLLSTPWQYIKPLISALAQRARYNHMHTTRAHTKHTPALDHQALHRAIQQQTSPDQAIIRYIGSGAAWVQSHLHHITTTTPARCKFCGQTEDSIAHGLWHCPKVLAKAKDIRQQQHQASLQQTNADDVSAKLLLEPPPATLVQAHLMTDGVSAKVLLGPPPAPPVWTHPSQTSSASTTTHTPTKPPDHHTHFPTTKAKPEEQIWFEVDPTDLPTSLLHGLPPEMTSRLTHTFWGRPPAHTSTTSTAARRALGLQDSTRYRRHLAAAQDIEAQEQLAQQQAQHLPARQGFQALRGAHPPTPDIALPESCSHQPPDQPNAFSDGSLHSPTEPSFSLGGAGAWHPRRQMEEQGPSQAEANLAVLQQQQDGLKLFTHLLGYGGSSTRLEIAGAIVAFAANGPIHLGTDSKSFLTKALTIHMHINHHTLPKRPWALQKDGDLWKLYYQHVHAKGTIAINLSKVKGHATQQMVDDGTVLLEDKLGNDKADEAADDGVSLFGEAIVRLGRRFALRHARYTRMLATLMEHLCFMYRVRAMMLSQHDETTTIAITTEQPTKTPHTTATTPTYIATTAPAHRFRQVIVAQQCPNLCLRHPGILTIQTFLMAMPYRLAARTTDQQLTDGFTWLELYALYRLAGHPEPIAYTKGDATTRPALRQQLHAFRHAVRQLALHTMAVTEHHLFKGHQQGHTRRLQGLGIHTHLAALPWQPCLTACVQQRLAQEVVRSQHRMTAKKATQAIDDHQRLPLRAIQLKGRSKWSATIRPYTKALYHTPTANPSNPPTTAPTQPHNAASSTTAHDFWQPDCGVGTEPAKELLVPPPVVSSSAGSTPQTRQPQLPNITFFQCPRCPHKLPGTKAAFHHNNLDTRIWCNQCTRSLFVRLWQCSCGLPWHTCPAHKGEPDRLRALQHTPTTQHTQPTQPRQRAKRALGQGRDTQIHRWLDLPPPKRQRAEPAEVELEVANQHNLLHKRPNIHMLGPKLLAKFPRLSSSQAEPTEPANIHTTSDMHISQEPTEPVEPVQPSSASSPPPPPPPLHSRKG